MPLPTKDATAAAPGQGKKTTSSSLPSSTNTTNNHKPLPQQGNSSAARTRSRSGGPGSHQQQQQPNSDPMARSKLIQEDRWLNWNFFKGRLPTPKIINLVKSLALVAEPKQVLHDHTPTSPPSSFAGGAKTAVFSSTPVDIMEANNSSTNLMTSDSLALSSATVEWRFFVASKEDLVVNAVVKLGHNGGRALRLLRDCQVPNRSMLTPVTVVPGQSLFIHERGTLPFTVKPEETDSTAGLAYACYLMQTGVVKTCHAVACNKFRSTQGCPAGPLCLYIHVRSSQLPQSTITPLLEANTAIEEAIGVVTVEMLKFIQTDLKELGIKNLGDLQGLSPTMWEQLVNRHSDHETSEYWLLLASLRELPLTSSLAMTVIQFHGGQQYSDLLTSSEMKLSDIGSLDKLKNKAFYQLKLPVQLLDICEKIRNRLDHENQKGHAYTTLRLDEKEQPWFAMMAKTVIEFRATHAHNSWRKKDATRPVVTSAITYVDYRKCRCKCNKIGAVPPSPAMNPRGTTASRERSHSRLAGSSSHLDPSAMGDSPGKSPGGTNHPSWSREGTSTTADARNAKSPHREGSNGASGTNRTSAPGSPMKSTGILDEAELLEQQQQLNLQVPFADHWCQCPRQYEICVNYELSTPSGSRCSEQNCLGCLCSKGLPTSCIREVFVHGGAHQGKDTNPLFPCGVCENMLRRVSKDVANEHDGADVMLYMFDQEEKPKKLVCLPVTEISHRAGSVFKQFVEEEVKDDE